MLNGFELHVYNRCEKLFGLEPQIFSHDGDPCASVSGGAESKKAVFICAVVVGHREELNLREYYTWPLGCC
jgi:hypothetical protein